MDDKVFNDFEILIRKCLGGELFIGNLNDVRESQWNMREFYKEKPNVHVVTVGQKVNSCIYTKVFQLN